MTWLETFDASRALAATQFRFLLRARETRTGMRRLFQRAGAAKEPDLAPSDFYDIRDASRRGRISCESWVWPSSVPSESCGSVEVEVLQAGGWTRANMGDAFTAEDVFVVVVCDGGVGQTTTQLDAVAPAWGADERRAFRFPVADPAATLFLGVFDEGFDGDVPIGRCAVALRALAPETRYDAWLPLSYRGTEGERLATYARPLVADVPLKDAASAHELQAESRGAIRVRVRVEWDDGGVAACRSALTDVFCAPRTAVVATPATESGRRLRENVRFALWGPGGCPADELNEPFGAKRIEGYAHETAQDWLDLLASARRRIRALIRYEHPVRSLVALVAWISIVRQPSRVVPRPRGQPPGRIGRLDLADHERPRRRQSVETSRGDAAVRRGYSAETDHRADAAA